MYKGLLGPGPAFLSSLSWTYPSLFLAMKCLRPLGGPCKAVACTRAPGHLRESWGQLWPCCRVSRCRGGWISAHHSLPQCLPPNSGPQGHSVLTLGPFQHNPIQRLAPPHSSGFRIKVPSEVFSDGPPKTRSGLRGTLHTPLASVLGAVMAASMSAFPSGRGACVRGRVSCLSHCPLHPSLQHGS